MGNLSCMFPLCDQFQVPANASPKAGICTSEQRYSSWGFLADMSIYETLSRLKLVMNTTQISCDSCPAQFPTNYVAIGNWNNNVNLAMS